MRLNSSQECTTEGTAQSMRHALTNTAHPSCRRTDVKHDERIVAVRDEQRKQVFLEQLDLAEQAVERSLLDALGGLAREENNHDLTQRVCAKRKCTDSTRAIAENATIRELIGA